MTLDPSLPISIQFLRQLKKLSDLLENQKFETGYVLLYKEENKQHSYCLVHVPNESQSVGSYCPSDNAMIPVFDKQDSGWTMLASAHNHPKWDCSPSNTDLTNLFTTFPLNIIYSNLHNNIAVYDGEGHFLLKIQSHLLNNF
jgi:proteasome lid subunit RPN8/RPN11